MTALYPCNTHSPTNTLLPQFITQPHNPSIFYVESPPLHHHRVYGTLSKILQFNLSKKLKTLKQKIVMDLYKYKTPKIDPLKHAHYSLPFQITKFLINTFSITHSYFSSPTICPTTITQFHSVHPRDKIFGSKSNAFSNKWFGKGFAHPTTPHDFLQAFHWSQLATKENSQNITIIISPNTNWHHNYQPYKTLYQDSHITYHFPPNTMPYIEPTAPKENHKTRFEPNALQIIHIHHQDTTLKTIQQLQPLHTILANLNIPSTQ